MNSLLQLRDQVEASKCRAQDAASALQSAASSARYTALQFERLQLQYQEQLVQFAQEHRPSLVSAVLARRKTAELALTAAVVVQSAIVAGQPLVAMDALSVFSALTKAVQVTLRLVQTEAGCSGTRGPDVYLGECLSQMDWLHAFARQSGLESAQCSAFFQFEYVLALLQNGYGNWHFGLETYALTALRASVEA